MKNFYSSSSVFPTNFARFIQQLSKSLQVSFACNQSRCLAEQAIDWQRHPDRTTKTCPCCPGHAGRPVTLPTKDQNKHTTITGVKWDYETRV